MGVHHATLRQPVTSQQKILHRTYKGKDLLILPVHKQINAWHKANRKMGWGIKEEEFDKIGEPPSLTESDRHQGYSDFFDAAQIFCSNEVLGLGIGNMDRDYPLFGIPTLRLLSKSKVIHFMNRE